MKNGWRWVLGNKVTADLSLDWQRRLNQYSHLYIGYSGGLDSTVLLTAVAACPDLYSKITAIHVHHGLSPHAETWLAHCQQYCQNLGIPCKTVRVNVSRGANLEERARLARYQAFASYIEQNDALLLAHHQNDQTETVLLNLFRGAGIDGLAAMPEERALEKGVVLRPFLQTPRQKLFDYAQQHALCWIEDEMNRSSEWSRSYLRQHIIPLLQSKWPNLNAAVSRTAMHCQEAKYLLTDNVESGNIDLSARQLFLNTDWYTHPIRCTHVLRAWLKRHLHHSPSRAVMQQIMQTIILAKPDAMPQLQLEQWILRRYRHSLFLTQAFEPTPQNLVWINFPEPILWQNNQYIVAIRDDTYGISIPNQSQIEVKCRQGGEHIRWHGQTQSLKKLFQAWQLPPWERLHYPLVYVNGELAAIPNHAHSDIFLSLNHNERYTITTYQP